MKIYDISIPITSTLPTWPGDPPVEFTLGSAIARGDSSNVTRISMSIHTGTHIDAPKHFIETGGSVDQIPLKQLIGEVLVIEIDPEVNVLSKPILDNHPDIKLIGKTKKVLFKTRNSNLWQQYPHNFRKDFVGIDTSGARFLHQFNLDMIGIDYLSVAAYDDTELPHQILLSGGCVLLEGLDLSKVTGGFYEIYCLPLNLPGCEGAPARAILVDRKI